MIKSFADKHSRDLFITGKSRRLPPHVIRRAIIEDGDAYQVEVTDSH